MIMKGDVVMSKGKVLPPSGDQTMMLVLSVFGSMMAFAAVMNSLFDKSGIPELSTNILDELEKAAEDLLLGFASGFFFTCILFVCSAYQLYYVIRLFLYFRTKRD